MGMFDVVDVFWGSRHDPRDIQIATLEKGFSSKVNIRKYPYRWKGHEEVAAFFEDSGCSELVLVSPDEIFIGLTQNGYRPIKPVTRPCEQSEADWVEAKGYHRFLRFDRILRASLNLRSTNEQLYRGKETCVWLQKAVPTKDVLAHLRKRFNLNFLMVVFDSKLPLTPADMTEALSRGRYDIAVVERILWQLAMLRANFPDTLLLVDKGRNKSLKKQSDWFQRFKTVTNAQWEHETIAFRVNNQGSGI